MMKVLLGIFGALASLSGIGAGAAMAEQDNPSVLTAPPRAPADIIVTGDREEQVRAVRALTSDLVIPARIDKPFARFHQPFCPATVGIKTDYAVVINGLMRANAKEVGAPVGAEDCTPNALLMFAKDGSSAIEQLREDQAWLFKGVPPSKIREMAGPGEMTYAWSTSEVRGVDGRPMRIVMIGDPPREAAVNEQFQTGRLNPPIRMDVMGAAVLIDLDHVGGKTLEQLAAYATIRLLATVRDREPDEVGTVPSVLSLFTQPEQAPAGLTRFDLSLLRAFYAMRPNERATAILDTTARYYLSDKVEEAAN
ncbi:MAG: hypothetical protein ACK4GD_05445 [Sphingomonadaceae bacterium]